MKIAMVAAAAYGEHSAWMTCVGEWLTELAFENITRDEAINLLSHIQVLCQLEPSLWETCARAEAACRAFSDSAAA